MNAPAEDDARTSAVWLRLLAGVLALACGIAAVLVVVLLIRTTFA